MLRLLTRDSLDVAPRLLGATIRTIDPAVGPSSAVSIRLSEVEAYRGEADPGSHAYRGRTARNESMFAPAGGIYVYFTYGMHHCVNIVCGEEGVARAVLLRGGEVVEGVEIARSRRPAARIDRDLARGPARLCAALGLTRVDDGIRIDDWNQRVSLVLPATPIAPETIRTGPRTGVAGPGGDGTTFPWRFWIEDDPTVSPYRSAARRPRR